MEIDLVQVVHTIIWNNDMINKSEIDKRVDIEVKKYRLHAFLIFIFWLFLLFLASFVDAAEAEGYFLWYILGVVFINFVLISFTRISMGKFPLPIHNIFFWGREFTFLIACLYGTKKKWGIFSYFALMFVPPVFLIIYFFVY
ncbi:hypothetical protein BIY24_13730 [Halobacteriovorax marinus]|nr:hypothetical protein BIY24_13730 [Halobacteriovorax marinus]